MLRNTFVKTVNELTETIIKNNLNLKQTEIALKLVYAKILELNFDPYDEV